MSNIPTDFSIPMYVCFEEDETNEREQDSY